jgi:ketosteroid isomerase-like protein
MTGSDHNETAIVQRMFAAFAAGDLDALLETVHPRSRWVYYGANPGLSKAEFNGRAEVRSFFERIIKRLDMSVFNANEFVAQGKTVVVFGNESGNVKATGQGFHNEWAQKYVVEGGLIVEMAEWNVQVAM